MRFENTSVKQWIPKILETKSAVCHSTSGGRIKLTAGGEEEPARSFGLLSRVLLLYVRPELSNFVLGRSSVTGIVALRLTMFRATSRLLDCRITLFTRTPCSLCDTAKSIIGNVKSKKSFIYNEINVMESGQEKWKAIYEFDTPVV